MRIVLTDAKTVSAGDIDLSLFSQFGEVVSYDHTTPEQVASRIASADVVLLNKTILDKKALDAAPHLKYIGVFATGYNVVDVDYCKERGICVCNAGTYSTEAVAQTVFAFILHHYSRVADYARFVEEGGWRASPTFSPFVFPTMELAGKTLGIVGYGSIGRKVADIALAFSMKVLVYTRTPSRQPDGRVCYVDFPTLLQNSDVISCHCPLTPLTSGLFDEVAFSQMKKGAYFVNTSRGGVVVEDALRHALESEHLGGAGIDVLTIEPMAQNCVLQGVKNLTITPHVAWAHYETRKRLVQITQQNLRAYLEGHPQNVIV
ncbi:MAG: D-2-hydroxyacid dehydrogenase [Clostridia bacterium]|nr:D-2-hydroxyacid dehydrogenase [Clostridia bacterium]